MGASSNSNQYLNNIRRLCRNRPIFVTSMVTSAAFAATIYYLDITHEERFKKNKVSFYGATTIENTHLRMEQMRTRTMRRMEQ